MQLNVSVHLRKDGKAPSDPLVMAVAGGLAGAGCKVDYRTKYCTPDERTDLVVIYGFQKKNALIWALENEMPFLIIEAPHYRLGLGNVRALSFGYGGLGGGGFHPAPPTEERPKPKLKPMKSQDGPTAVIGQKPTDHSLRGTDHNAWIEKQLRQNPGAEFRPHPNMVQGGLEPTEEFLERIHNAITFSSTLGAEALVAGVNVTADHYGSVAYRATRGEISREEWLHWLSWTHGEVSEFRSQKMARHILSGYDEAKHRAEIGLQEWPREKVMCPIDYSFDRSIMNDRIVSI